ncbi:MAG: RNA-binding protein [Desulfotomaculum sp.]|nr:RNA-binding protein [Desulfotomaculum sp.]
MPDDSLKVGQLVSSKAGRDKGKIYVVIGTAEENRVWVADGRTRTVDKPKKKNVKHLQKINFVIDLSGSKKCSNEELRKCIAEYQEKISD